MKFLSDILAKAGLTVDGVVTFNNTATGQTPATGDNSTKLATTAFIKNQSYITANQTITVSGDATGSGTTSIALTLANSGVTAGTYGNASNIPTIVVDAKGRITSISTNAVSIVTTLAGLSDVTLTSPSANQVLQYNGTQWVNGAAPTTYTLPIATASTLGGIKVGTGLSIDAATGVLSATAGSNSSSVKSTQTFIATAGQTVFTISGGYTVGLIDVFLNGVYLSPNQTTATNGTTVILGTAAAVDDIIDVIIASPIYQGSTVTTDQLPEGSTNLYFTNARVLSALSGRTLTINGTTYDLSANRSWSVGTVTSVAALTIGTSGSDITSTVANSTSTPVITLNIPDASASARGVVTTSAQTFAGAKTFSSTVAINTTSPYDTTQFSLDVNGGLLVKNIGRTAQFVLINANPASGGNAGFVVHTVGGTSASSFADIQGYYGTSIAGSTVLRLNPQGGNVLVGSLAGSGTRIVVADATGVLSTQAAQTLNDLNGVPTSRTITINGTTFDLTANRSFTINSMVYPGAGIAVSTGSAWGTSLTDNSSNWNTAFGWGNHASAGYATTTYVNTQVANLVASAPATLDTLNELAAALGNDAAFSTTVSTALGNRLRVDTNAQGLNGTQQGNGRTNLGLGTAATSNTGDFVAYRTFGTAANNNTGDFAAASHTHSIANVTGLQTALDGKQASGSYAASVHSHSISDVTGLQTALDGKQASLGFTPYNSTNPAGYISSYTETDTLASVTARGATTSTNSIFSGGLQARKNQSDNNYTTAALWTESYGNTTTGIAFHISGVVGKFLEMRTNGILYWENGQVWTSSTLTNLNQLTNGPGYITSYSETDTLASVTSRGASTSTAISLSGNLTMSGAGNSTSIIFGDSSKRINVEGYWMMFKGHENEGFRWQTAGQDAVTYTTRMQLTSSALTVNGNTVLHASNYSSYALPLSGGVMTGALVNNTDGAVIIESNASENNNWLWKENAKTWGLFWFNRGTQSGQTIGTYTTIGAELMFMGGGSGIAMPSGWTGYIAGSNIAAMISNYTGYIYSASTIYAATSMIVGGYTVYHTGNLPTIPTNTNQLTNGSGYITSGATVAGLNTTFLGTGSTNIDSGYSRVLRNENGSGGNLNYAPVLHLAASDTMWQIQGDYYDSSTLRWRAGYAGTWYTWRTIIHSGNIGSQSVANANTVDSRSVGTSTNNIPFLSSTRNLVINNPESYSGEVRLGAAWDRGGVYASSTLTMSTSSGNINFVSNDTAIGGFRWDTTNGSRFIVSHNDITTPYTLIDANRRPVMYARGAYPVLVLDHTETSNANHGPTIQFAHNGLDQRQWVIGSSGNGSRLDFGMSNAAYGNSNYNPHNGIAGYLGKTVMRITETGVAIGSLGTYPTINSPSRPLHVYGRSYFTDNMVIVPTSESWAEGLSFIVTSTNTWAGIRWRRERGANDGNWYIGYTALDATDDLVFGANNGGAQVDNIIRLTKAGNVSTQGSFTASGDVTAYSDARVKENILTIDNALEKTLALRGVYYNRTDKDDKSQKVGVIAQEIQQVLPQVVQEQTDGMLSVSYGNMAGLFIEAIKEQQTQIESQKSEIDVLKDLVQQLINR